MMIRYLLLISVLALSACQSNRLTELDYQPERNYHSLQSWQWAEPAIQFVPDSDEHKSDLDAERVRNAISEQLTQQGFQHSDNAQIQVRVWLITEEQQQRTQVMQSDYWGGIWGPSLRAESYDTTYSTQKLQIDLLDANNQQLIWRGSDSWTLPLRRISPAARNTKLRQQVQQVLQHFPPH